MLNSIFTNLSSGASLSEILLCTGASLGLGFIISLVYMWRTPYSKHLSVSIVLLPAIVQAVILLVNGNLGTGMAVMGAFSLVRFRSAPGSAREIACIFFAMAVGLATGMGYVLFAILFTVIVSLALLLLTAFRYGDRAGVKSLKITIPEDLDYETAFTDIFKEYAVQSDLERVRTTNLGSLFELQYSIILKRDISEKAFIDQLRCRNGNLNIVCGKAMPGKDEL